MTRTRLLPALAATVLAAVIAAPAAQAQSLPPSGSSDPVLTWYDATRIIIDQAGYPAAGNTQIVASRTWAIAWGAAASGPVAGRVHIVAVFHEVTTDAQIAVYASKYRYLRWRPVTALRTDDGNPATPYDPAFTPLLSTPPHPEYPSGHTGYAGAAEAAFRALIGPAPKQPITITSPATPGVYPTYTDWSQPTQENIDARVWEGIHLRSTDTASVTFGKEVAAAALKAAGVS